MTRGRSAGHLLLQHAAAVHAVNAIHPMPSAVQSDRADVADGLLPTSKILDGLLTLNFVLAERSGLRTTRYRSIGLTIGYPSRHHRHRRRRHSRNRPSAPGIRHRSIPLHAIANQLGDRTGRPRSLLARGVRFAVIGVLSTIAYGAVRALRPAMRANLVALLTTAVLSTAANRRFTFGIRGTTKFGAPSIRRSLRLRSRTGVDNWVARPGHSVGEPSRVVGWHSYWCESDERRPIRSAAWWVFHPRRGGPRQGAVRMTVIEAQQISDRPTRRCDSVPRWYSGAHPPARFHRSVVSLGIGLTRLE